MVLTAGDRLSSIEKRFEEINASHTALDPDQVRKGLKALVDDYPEVTKTKAYIKLSAELEVIGRDAGELKVKRWFQGRTEFRNAAVTVLLFWEAWCPHCQDEMPRMQKMFQAYREKDVNFVGLTKISKTATVTSVIGFITENNLGFSIGKDDGSISKHFGVTGVPAAAIVKNGKIIWRGNPTLLKEVTLDGALAHP